MPEPEDKVVATPAQPPDSAVGTVLPGELMKEISAKLDSILVPVTEKVQALSDNLKKAKRSTRREIAKLRQKKRQSADDDDFEDDEEDVIVSHEERSEVDQVEALMTAEQTLAELQADELFRPFVQEPALVIAIKRKVYEAVAGGMNPEDAKALAFGVASANMKKWVKAADTQPPKTPPIELDPTADPAGAPGDTDLGSAAIPAAGSGGRAVGDEGKDPFDKGDLAFMEEMGLEPPQKKKTVSG